MISHAGGAGAKDDSLWLLLSSLDAIQILHVVAATAWIAGVLWVAIAFRDPTRGTAAARRFRTPAVGLLAVVVLTGYRNALPHFDFGSSWSWTLLAKVALVVTAVALGARVRKAWSVRVEAGILGVVGAMGLVLGLNVPFSPTVVVLASSNGTATCRAELAGSRAAARAVGGVLKTFSGAGCGVTMDGVTTEVDWFDAGRAAGESLLRRGVVAARIDGPTDTSFARGVRTVLPDGDGAVFLVRAEAIAAAVPTAEVRVVAPWLLADALRRPELSLLVASQRDLTDQLAINYRGLTKTPTASGLEGFVKYLAAVGGGRPVVAKPGLFAITRVEVMPPELQHAAHGGEWARGLRVVRL